jgi:hypothetical protein
MVVVVMVVVVVVVVVVVMMVVIDDGCNIVDIRQDVIVDVAIGGGGVAVTVVVTHLSSLQDVNDGLKSRHSNGI